MSFRPKSATAERGIPSRALLLTVFIACVGSAGCASVQLHGDKHSVQTADDWKLTLERFEALGVVKKKYPVLICHGLGANRQYFKSKDEDSLIRNLQRAGYEVWLMDLRGRSEAGDTGYWFGKHTYTYSMDEYVNHDLDAAIGYVLRQSGAPKLNYIGHSMGGMIMHARLGTIGDERVANYVAIASPMSFLPYNKWTFTLYRMRQGMVILPVLPLRPGAIMGSFFPEFLYAPFINAFLNSDNTDSSVKTLLMQRGINNIAKPEIKQFIHMTEHGGIFSADGKTSYSDNLGKVRTPVYLIAARRDELADPAVVREVYERVGSADKTFEIFSRADGYVDDYGHTDLIIGKQAHREVHPKIIDWLNKRN